jgi:hypothetical protein
MSLVSMGLRPAVHMAQHLKTGKIYRVLAEGIDQVDPNRKVVVYEQLHDYVEPEAGVMVPRGTVWVQDKKTFGNEFIRYAVR